MLGEWIADNVWHPIEIDWEDWVNFLDTAVLALIVSILFVYILYLFLFPRFWRIRNYGDVFKLRGPFKYSLGIILTLQVVVDLVIFLAKIPDAFSIILYPLECSLITGLVGIFSVWTLALIHSPAKIKFTPWGRRIFFKMIR